jgi:hypothetical protein
VPGVVGWELQSQGAIFAYYCTVISAFSIIVTTYYVPYTALTMELSDDPRERDAATAWRMVGEVLCTVVAVVLQSFIIAEMVPSGGGQCVADPLADPLEPWCAAALPLGQPAAACRHRSPSPPRGGGEPKEGGGPCCGGGAVGVSVRVCVVARSDGDDEEDCECTSGGQVDVPCLVDADCRPPGCGLSAPVDSDDEGASNAAAIAHLVAAAAICAMVLIPGIVTACGVPERPQFTQKRGCTINVGLCGRSRAERKAADRARRAS